VEIFLKLILKELFRNNVLHLWPWVIEDLKSLGAKSFYPRFCTGTMNHISKCRPKRIEDGYRTVVFILSTY
jgi:hypothetical protein